MSEPIREVTIRSHDYYGGDLCAQVVEESADYAVEIVWTAWGQYGESAIKVSLDEAKQLAAGLMAIYDTAPEWVYKTDDFEGAA